MPDQVGRILVVDDEPFMLKLLVRMLSNLGYSQVTPCDGGVMALEWMSGLDGPPDVIVCDLRMPEMDGVEFMRKLAERGIACNVILISGEDRRVLRAVRELVQTSCITVLGYLQKPFEPESLTRLLGSVPTPIRTAHAPGQLKIYSPDEVRDAIAGDQFVNFYQPQVVVATEEVAGAESLVRWRHPTDGLVCPAQFVGVAEEHGLIDDLTAVVLRNALAESRALQNAGLSLRVSINISSKNLESLDFPDFVFTHATFAGVAPQNIALEVTESQLMQDPRVSLEILMRLRLKGFCLSIDDFGTGHSSLAQLRDVPFHEMKVDKRFVHGACSDETSRAIYDVSLNLAGQLGMTVVAEGIEDQRDWDFVCGTGCDLAQGYHIANPMPGEALIGWIKSYYQSHPSFSIPGPRGAGPTRKIEALEAYRRANGLPIRSFYTSPT